ncbi:MAG: hypothetical protein JNL70_25185 [Saprospiraceae bacterium]|nr:hypothetical protein [Saprospiraceae bacterium]
MSKFKNPLDPDNSQIKQAIRKWIREQMSLDEAITIDISEHNCSETNCVYAETMISVDDTEGVRFYKIAKPLIYVRKLDILSMRESKIRGLSHRH